MATDQKKKRPGARPEKKTSRTKVKGASEPPSRPGPKSTGRARGSGKPAKKRGAK